MAFPDNSQKGRIGQSTYWMYFGANLLLVPTLLIGGLYALGTGSYGIGILLILLLVPLGIWFRVVMMRRCRDIGWPAFLPWLNFGISFLFGFFTRMGAASGDGPGLGMAVLPLILGLADFIFTIVIGCIGSKAAPDYGNIFGPDAAEAAYGAPPARTAQPRMPAASAAAPHHGSNDAEPDLARYDDAIARALEAHKQRERLNAMGGGAPAGSPASVRGAATFGRRVA